ncbi:MAG: hypothetical protein PWP31_1542 [Clostridia bacterium]|nr:hypothetical protein [Clostridia bacterium]
MTPNEFACPGGTLYTIQPGDTLYALSQRFGVSLDRLLAANPGIEPENLKVGQGICIPAQFAKGCPGFTYRIKPGDTFYQLAHRYGTSIKELIEFNPGVNPNNLQIGQAICIPVKS